MKIRALSLRILWVILAMVLVSPVMSAQAVDSKQEENPARLSVDRMARFISAVPQFSVTADIGFDAVQRSGQEVEFGETRDIVLERPGHLRVDAVKRSGEKSSLTFDGKNLSLYYEEPNVYASDPVSGSVDEVIKYVTDDLGLRLPFSAMLSSQLPKFFEENMRAAAFVEDSSIAGVACDHVVLRGDEGDMQLWIAKGEKPLPQRLVITYKKQMGQPQFRVQFSHWNLAPQVSAEQFSFSPPKDSKKVPFPAKAETQSQEADAKAEVKS